MYWVLAIATILGGIAALWFFWDKLLEKLGVGKAKQAKLRDRLAALMLEGQALDHRLTSTGEPLETLEPDIESWGVKAETWLEENLGNSYLARFRNGAGVALGGYVMRRPLNTKEGPLNGFLRVRLARLGEFIAEHS